MNENALVDFGEECKRTQLRNMLSTLPAETQERFLPAAMHAASVLEWISPAIIAPTGGGLVSGVFSNIMPDAVAIIAASSIRVLLSAAAISDFDLHAEDAVTRFTDADVSDADRTNVCGQCIVKLLEDQGAVASNLSKAPDIVDLPMFTNLVLWRAKCHFALLREAAQNGIATAVLVLAGAGDGLLTMPICYARHCPPNVLAEWSGAAA